MRSAEEILEAIRELEPQPVKLMEVCGTHTMAIAKAGIKTLLPEGRMQPSLTLSSESWSLPWSRG